MSFDLAATYPTWPKKRLRARYQPKRPTPPQAEGDHNRIGNVSRRVSPHLHVEGHDATNMLGDIQDMKRSPHISGKDRFILDCVAKAAFTPSTEAPDGYAVALVRDDRDWKAFIGVRNRFLGDRADRIAAMNAALKANRAAAT